MKFKLANSSVAAAFFLVGQTYAQSAVMIQPQLIFTNVTSSSSDLSDLTNQSGLSVTYQSGVTDFDTYMASSPTGPSLGGSGSVQFNPGINTIFDFDLGATVDLTNVLLLNQPSTIVTRVVNFRISISGTPDFATFTDLGVYTSTPSATLPVPFQSFDLPDAVGRYARLEILTNGGHTSTRFNEIAFAGNPVVIPEPSTAVLGAMGLLAAFRRRR